MTQPRSSFARGIVIAVGALAFAVSVYAFLLLETARAGLLELAALALFVLLTDLFSVRLPQGGTVSPSVGIILAGLFIYQFPDVMLAALAGLAIALGYQRLRGRGQDTSIPFVLADRAIVLFVAGVVFRSMGGQPGQVTLGTQWGALAVACFTYFLLEAGLDQFFHSLERRPPILPAAFGVTKLMGPLYVAFSALGVLTALMYRDIYLWTFPLFLLPLWAARHAFFLYLDMRELYQKTIRALATAIESQDPTRLGHAERVAAYSIAVARDMRVYGPDLELIGYAALLHDIGKLGIEEDTLDALLESKKVTEGEAPHAVVGAEIVDQVKYLAGASNMIRKHHKPFEGGKRNLEADHPLGSRVIGLVSYYDDLTEAAPKEDRLLPEEAMARIKREHGLRFDPKVLRSFARVLYRERKISSAML